MAAIDRIVAGNKRYLVELEDEQLPLVNIRHTGTILAFEVDERNHEYLSVTGHVIGRSAMEKGLYIRPLGNTVYLMPPYCITEEEAGYMYTTLTETLYRSIGNW